jgi:hypothetical protein
MTLRVSEAMTMAEEQRTWKPTHPVAPEIISVISPHPDLGRVLKVQATFNGLRYVRMVGITAENRVDPTEVANLFRDMAEFVGGGIRRDAA